MKSIVFFTFFIFMLFFVACSTLAPSTTLTPVPTSTLPPTSTRTPLASPTHAFTPTPSSTPTLTPKPTLTFVGGGIVKLAYLNRSGTIKVVELNHKKVIANLVATRKAKVVIRWSPDGRTLAYLSSGDDLTPVRLILWTIDTTTIELQKFSEDPEIREIFWSPDGKWVAYTTSVIIDGRKFYSGGLGTINIETKTAYQFDVAFDPQWSLDSTQLFYLDRAGHLIATDPTGSDKHEIHANISMYNYAGFLEKEGLIIRRNMDGTGLTLSPITGGADHQIHFPKGFPCAGGIRIAPQQKLLIADCNFDSSVIALGEEITVKTLPRDYIAGWTPDESSIVLVEAGDILIENIKTGDYLVYKFDYRIFDIFEASRSSSMDVVWMFP